MHKRTWEKAFGETGQDVDDSAKEAKKELKRITKEVWFISYITNGNRFISCTINLNRPVMLESIHDDIYKAIKEQENTESLSLTSMNKLGDIDEYLEENQKEDNA